MVGVGLWVLQIGGFLITLFGVGFVALQVLGWLQYEIWDRHSLQDDVWLGWRWPRVEWVGAQRIIDWCLYTLLSLPTSVCLMALGAALAGVAHRWAANIQRRLQTPHRQ